MATELTEEQRAKAEELFNQAEELQSQFWSKLGELERLLDIEIDSADDLGDTSLDSLLGEEEED